MSNKLDVQADYGVTSSTIACSLSHAVTIQNNMSNQAEP